MPTNRHRQSIGNYSRDGPRQHSIRLVFVFNLPEGLPVGRRPTSSVINRGGEYSREISRVIHRLFMIEMAGHLMNTPYDLNLLERMTASYRLLTGKELLPRAMPAEEAARWLYEEATFGLLAHNTDADPRFIYGNRVAQRWFGYSWDELIGMPSRLSAEAPEREERQRFLNQVAQHGFVSGYRGLRIAKSGQKFWIEDATVWELRDASGKIQGQAALLPVKVDSE
jgi:PAS domain S-box-containing protein